MVNLKLRNKVIDLSALAIDFLSETIMATPSHRDPGRHRYHKALGPYQRRPSSAFHPRVSCLPLPSNIEAILKSAHRAGPDFGDRRTFFVRNDSAIRELHFIGGNVKQCSSCGLRVLDYAAHLDDHFKQNR